MRNLQIYMEEAIVDENFKMGNKIRAITGLQVPWAV